MADVKAQHIFKGSIDQVFQGLTDYESYPDYIPGVVNIELYEPLEDGAELSIRYELNLIKKFHYTLNMFHEGNNKIRWSLHDSNLMKKNNGSWTLTEKKSSVDALYELDIKFKGLVPSAIVKKLTETSLPAMFEGFQSLIDDQE
jgi:ribosome-associated toxin RatA of RatAB toxin-antitoxin module